MQTYNSRKEGVDSVGGTVPTDRDVLPYIKQWVIIERPDQNHVFNTEKEAIDSLGGTVSATRKAVPYPLWVLVQKPDQNHIFNTEKEAIGSLGGTVPANRLVLPYVEKWAVVERPDQSHTFNTEKEAADSLGGAVAGNLQILPYTGWAAVEKPDDKHTFETEKRATDSLGGTVSGNQQVLAFPDWVVIEKPSIIEGKDLSRADASQSQGGGENGYLMYVKTSLTGDENDYIRDYARRYSRFPHESTGDQFFSEEQSEVYRALGFHILHGVLSGSDHIEVVSAAADAVVKFADASLEPVRRFRAALMS